ncbi:glutamine synthetase family protein [Mangrovicoccus sp. HB161399]|uniref:glutamine synthetase family protein n=1 Tax=Mangrovicoccus sp. HB161399 TaxID=2720392 RepID=UPI001557226E|nr:glutamine synthetase family protein [Mangrovicoccus sp. HB161399]
MTALDHTALDHIEKRPVRPPFLLAAQCDLNGVFRGKRLPGTQSAKLLSEGMRMPMSSIGVDIWGTDVAGSPLFEAGDLDGVVEPTGRGPIPLDWSGSGGCFVPMWMRREDGTPFFGDPRRVLAEILGRFAAAGLVPVVALELEFHLIRPGAEGAPQPVAALPAAHAGAGDTIYSLEELGRAGPFLDAVYEGAEACGIALEAVTSESGPGQYEFNLVHSADALRMADDAVFLKQIIRNAARSHGMEATFMAKPYMAHAGNGMHMHFSLLDGAGRNVFDDGGPDGTPVLRHAVAGLLEALHDTALIFAPHRNSARRLRPGTLAPVNASWGCENRTAAVRIPGGAPAARRIEHRVAGADANPYLVMAAVLAAALRGIGAGKEPVPREDNNVGAGGAAAIPPDWRQMIAAFEASPLCAALFPSEFVAMFSACKRQELAVFEAEISALEYHSYLRTV